MLTEMFVRLPGCGLTIFATKVYALALGASVDGRVVAIEALLCHG